MYISLYNKKMNEITFPFFIFPHTQIFFKKFNTEFKLHCKEEGKKYSIRDGHAENLEQLNKLYRFRKSGTEFMSEQQHY